MLYTAIQMPYELAFVDDDGTSWDALRVIDLLQVRLGQSGYS